MLKPRLAPMPTLAPLTPPDSPCAPWVVSDAAVMLASPPPRATVPRSRAEVLRLARSIATEPATPKVALLPLAPDFELACVLPWLSPPTLVSLAASVNPVALTVVPAPTSALLTMSALFKATAAPMLAPLPPAALPSALAEASVLADELRLTLPVLEVTLTPYKEASEVVSAMLTATPAATLIEVELPLLSLALASGVALSVGLEPPPPLAAAAPSALAR